MDDGGSRIRRRVSVRKRNRPSLESVFAASPATELKHSDEEKEDEEMVAGSRRRKTVDVQPVEVQPHHLSDSRVPRSISHLWSDDVYPGPHCACSLKGGDLETPEFGRSCLRCKQLTGHLLAFLGLLHLCYRC